MTGCFQGKDHLMNRGRAHAKVSLNVGLGGWSSIELGVVMDERQVLTLTLSEQGMHYRLPL